MVHRHAAYHCTNCGGILSASVGLDRKPDRGPEAGDALICKYCRALNIVTMEGLRPATPAERMEVSITLTDGNN